MKPTKMIHDLGQSLWLDNITRDLLNSGMLQRQLDQRANQALPQAESIAVMPLGDNCAFRRLSGWFKFHHRAFMECDPCS